MRADDEGWWLCVDSVGAKGGIQILVTGIRPMAWPRSVRRVRLQLVGDQFFLFAYSVSEIDPCFLFSITHAEQLLAPLLLCFTFASRHSRSFS